MSAPVSSQELTERVLARSRADGCVVIASESAGANLRWANNTLTTNGVARSRHLTVISVAGAGVGVVGGDGISSPQEAVELGAAADAAARHAAPAEDAAPLFGAEASAGAWDAPVPATTVSVFDTVAPELGAAFRRAGRSAQLLYGFASYDMTTTFVATSAGLRSRHDQPTGYLELNAKSADHSRSAWSGTPTADFRDLDLGAIHDGLERRLGWASRRVELPAGRYRTVLPPSAVADLMVSLYWAAEGRAAHEGRSVFSRPGGGTRVGERLSATPVTLRSDPAAPGMECAPFLTASASAGDRSVFDNGSVLGPTDWVADGVLRALVQTRRSASLSGLPYTPYVDNLVLEVPGAAGGAEDLVAGTERGLLLTCLWYIREVDPRSLLLTGLTRDGVYLIEDGEVTAAVNNFRFNESPVDVLSRLSGAGAAERTLPREWSDWFTRSAMPALRVDAFNMSSVSQAS